MNSPIKIRQISKKEEFKALKTDWETLLAQNHIHSAFLSWEWLYSWWETYQKGKKLWILTAHQDNCLVGIAPLMLEKRKEYLTTQRVLCSLGVPHIDVGGFILAKEEQASVLSAIQRYLDENKRKWDALEFYQFQLDDIEIAALMPEFEEKNYLLAKEIKPHYYVPIDGNWDEFVMTFSGNLRGDLRRRLRRIKEKGKLKFIHHRGLAISWEEVETVFQINEHGHYAYLYRSEKERELQKELFSRMRENNSLDIFLLYLDDHPLAYRYGFTLNNKFEDWRNGFDTRYFKDAPGKVLQLLSFQECTDLGYKNFDFLRGEEEYKKRMPSQSALYIQLRLLPRKKITTLFSYIWMPKLKRKIKKGIELLKSIREK